jgi:hypothetical protein
MNTRSMPGFTAETSLYKTRASYQRMVGNNRATVHGAIEMSLMSRFCAGQCNNHYESCLLQYYGVRKGKVREDLIDRDPRGDLRCTFELLDCFRLCEVFPF